MSDVPARRERENLRVGLQELIEYTRIQRGVMVEVGSHAGESAALFAASRRFTEVHCVDPWPNPAAESLFDGQLAMWTALVKHKTTSLQAATLFEDETLDLVYLDGDHSLNAVKADILAWLPKLKPTGFMSGHDFAWRWPGVLKAVHQAFGPPRHVFWDKSWIAPKAQART